MRNNRNILAASFIFFAVNSFFTVISPSVQAESISFECSKNQNGTPTTFAIIENRRREFLRWTSDHFVKAGYDSLRRCEEVTGRMNQYTAAGKPQFLTHGTMNNQPVICVAEKRGGGCTGLLYTLKRDKDAKETLRDLLQLNRENFKNEPRLEAKCRTYVEIRALIRGDIKKAESVCRGN
jgi:Circadian oscillating protein COP23